MVFELECYQKKEKEKISFELSWNLIPPPASPKEGVVISFNEPKVKGVEEAKNDPENGNEDLDIR